MFVFPISHHTLRKLTVFISDCNLCSAPVVGFSSVEQGEMTIPVLWRG